MPENRLSQTLSPEASQAVMDAVNAIRAALPYLIDLTPEERRTFPKMGDKSRAFVQKALELATQNNDFLPRSFDVEEMRKDVELFNAMQPLLAAVAQLAELMDDTSTEASIESYGQALDVYRYAKAAGKGAGLDDLLDDLGQRFLRRSGATVKRNGKPETPPAG